MFFIIRDLNIVIVVYFVFFYFFCLKKEVCLYFDYIFREKGKYIVQYIYESLLNKINVIMYYLVLFLKYLYIF